MQNEASIPRMRRPPFPVIDPNNNFITSELCVSDTGVSAWCEAGFAYRPATLVGAKCLTLLALLNQKKENSIVPRNFSLFVS
jgi:hypothetical protein